MKILIDADGCPVVDITIAEAIKRKLEVLLFSDTAHVFNREGAKCITVDKGADSVDFMLMKYIGARDMVITQDYGLAAMCLSVGGYALRQDGTEYTGENIDLLLEERYQAKKARMAGQHQKGHKKREPKEDEAYRAALIKILDNRL
ncbi:MAG: DUF188 domain-containing protein [Bacillota bacterium]|nr:DUF188 domain-containing protein [Bacillota bacterium]